MDLQDKVALVTGASRGVGAATAVALAEAGCHVACAARATREAPLKLPGTLEDTVERVEAQGRHGLAVPTNLAEPEQVEAMVQRSVDHFGRLDVLVNNAAITFVGDLDIPLRRYELLMAVNLRAPMIAMREAARAMRAGGGGAVVNVSSVAGLVPTPGLMAYGVSKIGLERMSVDAANTLHDDGVAVNVFRIDVPVASEGFVANTPGVDRSGWEPCEVAAEGMRWVLQQPPSFTGQLLSMRGLQEREGIMATRAERPFAGRVPEQLVSGLVPRGDLVFSDA